MNIVSTQGVLPKIGFVDISGIEKAVVPTHVDRSHC